MRLSDKNLASFKQLNVALYKCKRQSDFNRQSFQHHVARSLPASKNFV